MSWTGASSGIGEALAHRLAKAGCKLVLSATRAAKLEEVKIDCLNKNGRLSSEDILVVPLDISKLDTHQDAFDKVIKHFGKVNKMLINYDAIN